MKKFIYVFSEKDANKLLNLGYRALKRDEKGSVYIFVNQPSRRITFDQGFMLTDTLTF